MVKCDIMSLRRFAMRNCGVERLLLAVLFALVAGKGMGAAPSDQYIDFVETDGSQKVVLDYIPNSNTVVEAKVDVSSTSKNHCIFCARATSNNSRSYTLFMLKNGTGGWRFDYNNNNGNKSNVYAVPGTPVVVRSTCEGLYIDGVKKTTYTLQDFTAQNRMSLFFSYNAAAGSADSAIVSGNNANNEAAMKVYYVKIWDDNGATLRYDLRPYRDSNLANCLRDEVSGANIYPYSSSTPFGGPFFVWWEPAEENPAVFEQSATYMNGFQGTGSNVALFRGATLKTFVGNCALSRFASVSVEEGQLRGQKNGLDIFPGDISIETGKLVMNAPKTETDAAWTMYAATNGTVRIGPASMIGIGHIKHTSSYSSTLCLGSMVRDDPGGTLLVSAWCNNGGYYGSSYLGGKCRLFPAGFSDGETLPAFMAGGYCGDTSSLIPMTLLKYTSANGVVAADSTAFAEAGADDIALVSSDTVLDADAQVKALQFGAACNLEIPQGRSLTVGNGTDPAGVVFYPRAVATNFVSGSGTLDFGAAQGIFWIGNNNNRSTVRFGKVSISGTGGVVFAGRTEGSRSSLFDIAATNWNWTGSTYVDSCVLSLADSTLTEIDGDLYVRGKSSKGGGGLFSSGTVTRNFNGKVSFTGPGECGPISLGSSVSGFYPSFFLSLAWDGQQSVRFKGGVEVKHDVQFMASRNQYSKTNLKKTREIVFASPVSGDGNVLFPYGSADIRFQAANTYRGTTLVACESWLFVEGAGTLGAGDVVVTNAWAADSNTRSDMAKIVFSGKAGYAMGNRFSGDGMMEIKNSSLVFSNDVSIGKLAFDANSSAEFGGVVSASTKLTFPAGAAISAVEGMSPSLAVPNGAVLAGSISDVDIACNGVVTNRGTLAATRIGADRRLDPIAIDGDVVFEGTVVSVRGFGDALGGPQTILSVAGTVEGEPTFVFPETKAYAVTRTGNTWSFTKPGGLSITIR